MPEIEPRTPIAQSPLSLVMPVYEVEATIQDALLAWSAFLEGRGFPYELILVDDGSRDRTAAIVESMASTQPALKFVRHEVPLGFGACLRSGLLLATHPLLAYCDGSAGISPEALKPLLEAIDQVDLVVGYRVWSQRRRSWAERDYLFRLALRIIFGVHVQDVDCPLKLARRSIFQRIPIQSAGDFVQAEIIAKANFLGCLMTEVPVEIRTTVRHATRWIRKRSRRAEGVEIFRHADFGPTVPEMPPSPLLPVTEPESNPAAVAGDRPSPSN